jgi:large subunit ribosomal protein L29
MKTSSLRGLNEGELREKHEELADELFHLRLRRTTGQIANPMKARETRRDLARVKTILRERGAGDEVSE